MGLALYFLIAIPTVFIVGLAFMIFVGYLIERKSMGVVAATLIVPFGAAFTSIVIGFVLYGVHHVIFVMWQLR